MYFHIHARRTLRKIFVIFPNYFMFVRFCLSISISALISPLYPNKICFSLNLFHDFCLVEEWSHKSGLLYLVSTGSILLLEKFSRLDVDGPPSPFTFPSLLRWLFCCFITWGYSSENWSSVLWQYMNRTLQKDKYYASHIFVAQKLLCEF